MKTVIREWQIEPRGEHRLVMRKGAEILCVQARSNEITLWARMDPDAEIEERHIVVRGTGYAVSDDAGRYIGTVQMPKSRLVWHVFEGE